MSFRIVLAIASAAFLNAQSPAARPEFDVASIKPSDPGARGGSMGSGSGKFDVRNMSVRTFIAEAYNVKTFEIYGAPDWLGSAKYDVSAKAEMNPAVKQTSEEMQADIRLRLQMLLEDRCSLKVHRETKELPIFALTIAKSGVKVKPANCVTYDSNNRPEPGQPRPNYCGNMRTQGGAGHNSSFTGTGIQMSELVMWLAGNTNRTVIDKTGYTEKFDAILEWTSDTAPRSIPGDDSSKSAPADPAGPSIFTALQEQLGLKLESTKGPVEVLVIDHVEKPSAN